MHASYCPDCGTELESTVVEERERRRCPACSKIIWTNPKPVAWICVTYRGDVLLVRRAEQPDRGEWDIPGGFLERDEGFRDAAVRELEEETGVAVDPEQPALLDTIAFTRDGEQVVGVVFHHEVTQEPQPRPGTDADAVQLVDPATQQDVGTVRDSCRDVLQQL